MKNYCCQYFHTTKVILQLNRDQSITHSFSSTCSRRQSLEISGTGFLQAKCLYCHPTISVKVLTKQPTHLTAFFSGTTQVSRYQKGKPNLDFTEARDGEWQWNQLGHMQVCTALQTDSHASTLPLLCFYRPDALPAAQPTASKH